MENIGRQITIEYLTGTHFRKVEDDVVTGVVLAILPNGYRIKPIDSNRNLDIENCEHDDEWMKILSVEFS